MPRYLGRIVLTLIGVVGGLPGALFGFVLGTLLDQTRHLSFVQRVVWRVARNPMTVRDQRCLLQCATAVWGGALLAAEGPPRAAAVEVLVADPWWPAPEAKRVFSRAERQEALNVVLRQRPRCNEADLAAAIRQRVPIATIEALIRRLVAVAAADPRGISAPERAIISRICGALNVDTAVLRRAESEFPILDRAACELLGVPPFAEPADVRRAYRRLAARFHPDTAPELSAEQIAQMSESFRRIHGAYEVLLAQLSAQEASSGL